MLQHRKKAIVIAVLTGGCFTITSASAADSDSDALALPGASVENADKPSNLKLALEAAFGRAQLRGGNEGHESLRRFSADFVYATKLDKQWRFVLSDRVDNLHPSRTESTINSLRELYGGWQDDAANWVVEFGRINLRQGPAFGFNPTDYFRDSALRVATTVNPMLIREYRLGSVMLRGQRLWSDGSLSMAVSPKLADEPSSATWSADLGATNNRSRALLSLGTQWSSKTSTQIHAYTERGGAGQVGASISALQGDATVLYAEGTWGKGRNLAVPVGVPARAERAAQVAAGLTYTTESKLSMTAELEYNGFALSRSQWDRLAATAPYALGSYLADADRQQDLAGRRAMLLHAKQSDAFTRNLDLSAMLRLNLRDHSTLTWAEARYHFKAADLSLQWVRYNGRALSEFSFNPQKSSVQLIGTVYF